MKKLSIFLLAMLLSASVYAVDPVKIGIPQQCVNSATNPTTAEWLTCTQARAGTSSGNPLYTTVVGGGSSSANTQWYTGTVWANWKGQNAAVDSLSNSTPAPFVYNLPMFYNANLGKWDRDQGYARLQLYGGAPGTWVNVSQGVSGDSYNSSTASMLPTINLPMYFTGTGTAWNRARGAVAGADGVANTAINGTNEFTYNMVWDSVGSHWDRMTQPTGGTSGASGDTISRTQTGLYGVSLNHFDNGTNFQRWKGEVWDTSMDLTTAPGVLSFGIFYNAMTGKGSRWSGETWDNGIDQITVAPSVIGLTAFYEGISGKGYRWTGETYDAELGYTTNPNVNSFNVWYDAINGKQLRWAGEAWDDALATTNNPNVNAFSVWWDGSNSRRLTGEVWDADMGVTTNPNVNSFNVFRDATGSKNIQWAGALWSTDMVVTAAPNVNALTVYRDTTGSKNIQWIGEAWDNSMDLVNAPAVLSLGTFYNGVSSKGSYWYGETYDDSLASTVAPVVLSLGAFWDGAVSRRLTGAALSSDTVASTAVAPYVGAFNHGWNGSNWVRMRLGASNELQTTDISVRPGEDAANGYRKVRIESVYNLAPTKKTTAVDSAGTDIVVASYQVIGYTNYCMYVKNVGGGSGAAFNNLQFQSSPDDTSWTGDLGWTDCDTAASGTTCVYCVSNGAYNYVRAVASTASSDTTADGWLTLNKG